jgi:hypothetical protein
MIASISASLISRTRGCQNLEGASQNWLNVLGLRELKELLLDASDDAPEEFILAKNSEKRSLNSAGAAGCG